MILKELIKSEYEVRFRKLNDSVFKHIPETTKDKLVSTMTKLRGKIKELDQEINDRKHFINTKKEFFNVFLVEAKKHGERILIHKKENNIKLINSAGDEISNPLISDQALKLTSKDYVIDGVLNENSFFCSDILYFDAESLVNNYLFKRKMVLEEFNWTDNIKENEYVIVDNKQMLKRSCEMLSTLSEQVWVKAYDSFYNTNGLSDDWFIYNNEQKLELKQIHADVKGLSPILNSLDNFEIIHDFISIVGSTVKSETDHTPNDIDIHLRMKEPPEYIKRSVEVRISKMLPESVGNKLHFIWGDPEGSHDSFCPVYHLALVRAKPEIVKMAKGLEPLKTFKPMKSSASQGSTLFYNMDDLLAKMTPILANKQLIVEKKYDGFHVLVHKKGDKVEILTEENNYITKSLPELVEQIKKLSEHDFIIEGELVAYDDKGDTMGRAPLIKYVMAEKLDDPIEKLRLHIWDILYYKDKSLADTELYERKKSLNTLDFTDTITKVHPIVVSNRNEFIKAVEKVSAEEGSEGAMIKRWESIYKPNSQTNAYIKYKVQQKINVVVLGEAKTTTESSVYKIGIYIPEDMKERILDKRLSDLNGKPVLLLGNTFLTKLKANIGDVLELGVEQVWRHKQTTTGKVFWSIHKPRVLKITKAPVSTWQYLDELAVSRGQEISFSAVYFENQDIPKDEGGTREEAAIGFWANNWHDMYPKSGKGDFVYQRHWRGLTEEESKLSEEELMKTDRSVHGDLRGQHDSDGAWGWTVFLGKTQDNPWPDDKFIEQSKTHKEEDKLRGHPKLRIPAAWLDVGKNEPVVSFPGGVGSTSEKYAKFFAVDYGTYEIGVWREHFFEIFLNGEALKGKLDVSYVPVSGGRVWMFNFPKDQTPYATIHNRDDVIRELHKKKQKWLIWNNPDDKGAPEKIDVEKAYSKLDATK